MPLELREPLELRSADSPGELPDLLAWLDTVAECGEPGRLAAGFLTYEAGLALEGSGTLARREGRTPLAWFALFDLAAGVPPPTPAGTVSGLEPQTSLGREAWDSGITAIRDGIARGDVYQVNLTRRITLRGEVPPAVLADRLYDDNPVPFALTLEADGFAVVSNSPELLLEACLRESLASSGPIKGTVPRGGVERDEDAKTRLLASEKDAAEHLMIVDLVRNDLGKVAVPGGVRVASFRSLRTFRHLHHLESIVTARLRPDTRLSEVLQAILPGGSVTGAPKRAALRFIHRLEPCSRGPYTGAVGYARGDGTAVFNVPIRTAIVWPGGVDYHTGGGIVWDSDAAAEWAETETKSRELVNAVEAREPSSTYPQRTGA